MSAEEFCRSVDSKLIRSFIRTQYPAVTHAAFALHLHAATAGVGAIVLGYRFALFAITLYTAG